MRKWSQSRKTLADYFTRPVVGLLAKTSITPNTISWLGFLGAIGAVSLIISGHLLAAGIIVLVAGFLDILDGALARSTNQNTKFGAILDSSLDRLSEAIVLMAILIFFLNSYERPVILALLVTLTIIGSFMVSYVRARAEALDLKGETGLFSRTERVIVLALGLLLSQINYALITALALIMVFSFITVSQRLLYAWRQTKN